MRSVSLKYAALERSRVLSKHVTSWFDGTVVMNCQLRVSLDIVLGEVIINLKKLTSGNILHINLTTAHCAEII